MSAPDVQNVYAEALLHVISRLVQAIYRESGVARLSQGEQGHWYLDVGRAPVLRAPATGSLPFRRVEVVASPWLVEPGRRKRLRTIRAFMTALTRCLARTDYAPLLPALRADFENSVANVVLNRLIGRSLGETACAIEPAYQGHQYYPFPALRIGPSLPMVLECSNLCAAPVDLPLIEVADCRMVAPTFSTYERGFNAWSGLQAEPGVGALLPLHPWHQRLSPVVRGLLAKGFARLHRRELQMIPLASQRTCRIVGTGYDVKMPVDATLTGEHRLLYQLNCENAPAISVLAKHLSVANGCEAIEFQEDVASIFHTIPELTPHLGAIIRAPVPTRTGECVVPAINLWTGRHEARELLRCADATQVEEFFSHYCRALMTGPVQYCIQWGMAFEPHLQNVYLVIRDGLPTRVILRDLDATVLEERRIRPVLRELRMQLAPATWKAMPPFEIGSKRLVQAMLFGHLGEVMLRLTRTTDVAASSLGSIVEDTWSDLTARAPTASARRSVQRLRGWSDSVKATLHTRLSRSTTMAFVEE